ncbi:uncharacterized protein DS421_3g70020 [Arachis hypogaea]|nr:uncharacterized protein DS421_3g70020 [Arachis hypogaea]
MGGGCLLHKRGNCLLYQRLSMFVVSSNDAIISSSGEVVSSRLQQLGCLFYRRWSSPPAAPSSLLSPCIQLIRPFRPWNFITLLNADHYFWWPLFDVASSSHEEKVSSYSVQ